MARELAEAKRRVSDLELRRTRLQQELEIVEAAERESRQSIIALRSIAAQMSGAKEHAPASLETGDLERLSGSALREAAARVALQRAAHSRPVPWREWFSWLREAGFDAAGKKSEATFLTQLARSPLVRRGEQDGIYVLDIELLREQRDHVLGLHERLAQLPPASQLAFIGDVRDERRALEREIARAERGLEESWRLLSDALGDDAPNDDDLEALIARWHGRAGRDETVPPVETPLQGLQAS